VRLSRILAIPFRKQRPAWQLPGNAEPSREPLLVSPGRLLA
jgi:hypothetical protein